MPPWHFSNTGKTTKVIDVVRVLGWVHLVLLFSSHPSTRGEEHHGQKVEMKMKVSERTIDTSGQIVLACSGCGEHITLLGHEDD